MSNWRKFASVSVSVLAFSGAASLAGDAKADIVHNDDVIIIGSLCVGFDCVNGEAFGFDTIRLKENNTRITFMDTSAGTFPTRDWSLVANSSASGGLNYFGIRDCGDTSSGASECGTRLFAVSAGAPAESIFVASTGRVGFRTATPVLDLHVRTSNTPAHRLEQDNSGGFTAQTWDIAGNEANFFVRDVTGGSRLPFRIRPGAPTSSIDIAASGNVGIGLTSPVDILHAHGGALSSDLRLTNTNTGPTETDGFQLGVAGANSSTFVWNYENTPILFATNNTEQMRLAANGNLGIGTTGPTARLHTIGTVRFAGLPNCASGIVTDASGNLSCAVSSMRFKTITGDLAPDVALANVMALQPQVGAYKDTPEEPEHWLIAEDVAAVDRALVGLHQGKPYTVKTQNVVADLIAVIQQQQRRIEVLEQKVAQ
jgi:hypothetical protein